MKIREMFDLQEKAARQNIQMFPDKFGWSETAIELMIDSHVFLGNDPDVIASRMEQKEADSTAFDDMNVIVNLAYDASGSLLCALRLLEYGLLADTWSLIRGAFESSCYAEFFSRDRTATKDYLMNTERLTRNRSGDPRREIRGSRPKISKVIQLLQKGDGEDRAKFYGRLSHFGTHASPVRAGLRFRVAEPEVRIYLSIGHREMPQCLADFAATAKYTLGIPFDAWPDTMSRNAALFDRYFALEKEYATVFMS